MLIFYIFQQQNLERNDNHIQSPNAEAMDAGVSYYFILLTYDIVHTWKSSSNLSSFDYLMIEELWNLRVSSQLSPVIELTQDFMIIWELWQSNAHIKKICITSGLFTFIAHIFAERIRELLQNDLLRALSQCHILRVIWFYFVNTTSDFSHNNDFIVVFKVHPLSNVKCLRIDLFYLIDLAPSNYMSWFSNAVWFHRCLGLT